MALTPEEIEAKKFLVGLRGYDKEEVTTFLGEVAGDYRSALAGGGNGSAPAAAESADPVEDNSAEITAEAERRAAGQRAEAEFWEEDFPELR